MDWGRVVLMRLGCLSLSASVFLLFASQQLRHAGSSLRSLTLMFFPIFFSARFDACLFPSFLSFFFFFIDVCIYLYIYLALLNHLQSLWALNGCRLSPPVQQVINQASIFLPHKAPAAAAGGRDTCSCFSPPTHPSSPPSGGCARHSASTSAEL